ncbi:MAG: four helix bundle protein [Melioribacteraceae bacterium]|nr:four helix bundle protein [Melioribacteraceae bacterium]
MRDFKKYSVWEKSHEIVLEIYRITKNFPKDEFYGLVSQMRRSSSSIPTNIAEGCGRYTDPDFARFIVIASGSACELEYQIILSHSLKYINTEQFKKLNEHVNEVKKMLAGLHNKLTAKGK